MLAGCVTPPSRPIVLPPYDPQEEEQEPPPDYWIHTCDYQPMPTEREKQMCTIIL